MKITNETGIMKVEEEKKTDNFGRDPEIMEIATKKVMGKTLGLTVILAITLYLIKSKLTWVEIEGYIMMVGRFTMTYIVPASFVLMLASIVIVESIDSEYRRLEEKKKGE